MQLLDHVVFARRRIAWFRVGGHNATRPCDDQCRKYKRPREVCNLPPVVPDNGQVETLPHVVRRHWSFPLFCSSSFVSCSSMRYGCQCVTVNRIVCPASRGGNLSAINHRPSWRLICH